MTLFISETLMPEAALSVAGLTDYIQELLEQDDQLRQVWVTGEVSSANRHRSGLFFTLQDPDSKALIQCVVWSSQLSKLVQLPVSGEQLIILGSLRVYPQRGQYQLSVWQALPAGEGLQALRYRQLRNRLEAEGLFDEERKRSLPTHPQIIGIVTSSQAAAGVIFNAPCAVGIPVCAFCCHPLRYRANLLLRQSLPQLSGLSGMGERNC
jgi:exodeoxyribonuclease VII large subunit